MLLFLEVGAERTDTLDVTEATFGRVTLVFGKLLTDLLETGFFSGMLRTIVPKSTI